MHTLKKYMQLSIIMMLMTMGLLHAAPLMSLAQPAIEPSPLDVLENNGEGNVTFLMSERNDELVLGNNRFKVTVTLGKISLKNDDISGVKILDARNSNADVTNKFDVNYLSAPDYIVRIQQKATEDLPGDMRYLAVIPVSVRENTPVTNPGNGFLVNMSSEGDALADGDSSDYTFTRASATAVDDNASTPEDTPIDINVTANDTNTLAPIDSVTQPANGTAVVNPDGTVKYTPDPNFVGTDTFTYTAAGLTATVTVTVGAANDAPVAVDDNGTTPEDTAVDIDVTSNDTDVDGDTLVVDSFVQPTNGTVTQNADGTLKYTPDANFNGTDTFEYTVTDGVLTDTATVTVTITPVNDAPVAVDDSETTPEDMAVDINASDLLSNDSDVDGDSLTITSVGNPTNGTVVLVGTTVTFTPDANTTGPATFEYTISDGNGGTDTATVTIDVGAVNDAPVAVDDTTTVTEDTPRIIRVLDNDTDENNDSLTVTSVTDPANGTTRINVDGTVTYTPNAGFSGTDTFEYTIQDGNGGEDTATVTVTVDEVNDAPVAVDDTNTTESGTPLVIPASELLKNDTDVDGDTLTIVSVGNPTNGTVVLDGTTVTFTPDENASGLTGTFTYTIEDEEGATSTATVTVGIDTASAPDIVSMDDNTSTTVKTDDATPEINGTCEAGLEVIVQIDGEDIKPTTTCDANGTFSMIPEVALRDGEYNVTVVQVDDGTRSPASPVRVLIIELASTPTPTPSPTATTKPTSTATPTATPKAVQTCSDIDAPVAANDSANITKGEVSTINVQANDKGTNVIANSTRLLDAEGKAATTLYIEGKGTWLVDTTTGAILFDPDDVCEGTVSVKYVIADKCGHQSNPATVTVSFDGVCESTQSSDSGDALGNISMLLLALLTGTLGLFFVRREELNTLVK